MPPVLPVCIRRRPTTGALTVLAVHCMLYYDAVMLYHAYILECADGTLYCGSTVNLSKRLREHNNAKAGAHYTKTRRPVTLVYKQGFRILAKARHREAALKRLTRSQKLLVIKSATL